MHEHLTLLAAEGIGKRFGGVQALAEVGFTIRHGEIYGLIGPNGAGKTTLFNQITGEITPDAGSVHLMGTDITRLASRRRAHMGLSRTYQIITLFPKDSLLDFGLRTKARNEDLHPRLDVRPPAPLGRKPCGAAPGRQQRQERNP